MASTAIATVFLDRTLRITRFTPSAVELFNLIAADVGRPLSDLANRLEYPQIIDDARAVLDTPGADRARGALGRALAAGAPAAVPQRRGPHRRHRPHLSSTSPSAATREDALRESETQFRTIVRQAAAGVVHTDLDGRITLVNPRFAQLTGRAERALLGTSMFELVHADDRARLVEAFRRMLATNQPFELDKRYLRPEGGTSSGSAAPPRPASTPAARRRRRSRSCSTSPSAAAPSARWSPRKSACAC